MSDRISKFLDWISFDRTALIIFVLFILVSLSFVHRVPGLLGDEGSEGENVYELLISEDIVVQGERSYIGPLLDYVRVPFVGLFGYSILALRIPIFVFSLLTFILVYKILRQHFDGDIAVFSLIMVVLGPVYTLYQRLGWAITLIPFFAFLLIFLLNSNFKHKKLLAGLAAGLGMHVHVMFFATFAGILVGASFYQLGKVILERQVKPSIKKVFSWWPALIGFWAGFGSQFAVLALMKEDQGDVGAVASLTLERILDLPSVLPLVISASSYIARYTGFGLPEASISAITIVIVVLSIIAVILLRRKIFIWAWVIGLLTQLVVLMVMVDRYALRYFVVFVLGLWFLAGLGLGALSHKLAVKNTVIRASLPIGLALILIGWQVWVVGIPYLKTGGNVNDIALGNREDSAAAFVDTRELIDCLVGKGIVFSENVHIHNRLLFLSHKYEGLNVATEKDKRQAETLVHYVSEKNREFDNDLCPTLINFRLEPR